MPNSPFYAMANRFGRQVTQKKPVIGEDNKQAFLPMQPAGNNQAGSYLQFSGASPQMAPPAPAPSGGAGAPAAQAGSVQGSGMSFGNNAPYGTASGYMDAGRTYTVDENTPTWSGNIGNYNEFKEESTPTAEAVGEADSMLEDLARKVRDDEANWGAVRDEVNAQRDAGLRSLYEQAASRGMAESGAISGMSGDIYRAAARDLAKAQMAYQQQQIDNMKDIAELLLGDKWNQLDQDFQREMAEWMLENQAALYEWIQSEGYKYGSLEDFIRRQKEAKHRTGTWEPEKNMMKDTNNQEAINEFAKFLGQGGGL